MIFNTTEAGLVGGRWQRRILIIWYIKSGWHSYRSNQSGKKLMTNANNINKDVMN